ncbi:MAG: hypothetical protein QXX81_05860 [Zestosphaera sp.]
MSSCLLFHGVNEGFLVGVLRGMEEFSHDLNRRLIIRVLSRTLYNVTSGQAAQNHRMVWERLLKIFLLRGRDAALPTQKPDGGLLHKLYGGEAMMVLTLLKIV